MHRLRGSSRPAWAGWVFLAGLVAPAVAIAVTPPRPTPQRPGSAPEKAADARQAPAPSVDAAELERERRLAALVDEQAMLRDVRELCRLGPRMGGTESGAASADWLRARFEKLGLDARVVEDPPRWCHAESSWKVVAHRRPKAGAAEAETHPLSSAWPYGFSPKSAGRARLAREASNGGAWLVDRAPRRGKSELAPAIVLVAKNTTLDGAYPRISHLAEGDSNRWPVFGLSRPDAQWLEQALDAGDAIEVEFALEATIRRASPRTVVARLAARDAQAALPTKAQPWSAEHFLFCAHGDSDAGGPGADDNASGIATLVGIASAWKRGIDQGLVEAPAREIRFAIWGSEIHSSRALLEKGDQDGRVLGVINYDQAGYGSGADQLNVEPDDLPANVGLVRTALAVLADHGKSKGFPEQWATNKSLGGTDSYVFSESRLFQDGGRPAVTLFTSAWDAPAEHPRTPGMPGESWRERDQVRVDYDNYYHSAGDTPENTTDKEPWNMGWCARVGLLVARRVVAAERK